MWRSSRRPKKPFNIPLQASNPTCPLCSISTKPSIAVVEEHEFHSPIAVRSEFRVVWRVEVQKRTTFRLDLALKCATVDGWNSFLSGCSGTVGIDLNCRQIRLCAIRNLQKCAAVTGTRVYSTVGI